MIAARRRRAPRAVAAVAALIARTAAVDPTATLSLSSAKISAAPAAFGAALPAEAEPLELTLRLPGGLRDGCDPATEKWAPAATAKGGTALLAARSPNCTFEDRAVAAARAGLRALVVYNTVEGIYRNRSRAEDKDDYDCANGKGVVAVPFTKDDKLGGFRASPCARDCASGRCLLTGASKNGGAEVCCAWDTYMTLASSTASPAAAAGVAVVFVTMRDFDTLSADPHLATPAPNAAPVKLWGDGGASAISWSSVAIWALGVLTCGYAAYKSGDEIRRKAARALDPAAAASAIDDDDDEAPVDFELTPAHAVGFIVIASSALLVLFYTDLYAVVTVAFAVSSASSTATVCWRPLLAKALPGLARRELFRSRHVGAVSWLDGACAALGVGVAAWWLAARDSSYAWALQDLFGICLCVLFLGLIKLNSLRVASTLLGMAFVYDIFFVFISPYFFEESVMVKVATGKGPTKDADYCEKYPSDDGCKSTSLPMLLMLPRGGREGGGYTMLGLGDIVLPGLLVSFAARYDAAHRAAHGARWPKHFAWVLVAYAVGLGMANVAVGWFDQGQPALLYLVPCTLGVFCFVAKRDGTFPMFWHGPPLLEAVPPPVARVPYAGGRSYQQAEDEALLKVSF